MSSGPVVCTIFERRAHAGLSLARKRPTLGGQTLQGQQGPGCQSLTTQDIKELVSTSRYSFSVSLSFGIP